MNLTISAKGWIVIPAELRRKYNLKPGQRVRVIDYGGILALAPALADPIHQTAAMLHEPQASLTDALLEERSKDKAAEDER